ncbi:MAG: inositol monophosphatase [Bacteroidales bacterium]|nr:inositol monophosphatase [Bacteroidales bacterium]
MELENICKQTIEAVKLAGNFINEEHKNNAEKEIEEKGKHNFVTFVDKKAEVILVNSLKEILPEAGFITEEGTIRTKGEKYDWIIDPLDGTTNFIHGAFPFAVSVALAEHGQPIVGVVMELGLNECFYGWKDGGAYLNDKPLKVSSNKTLHDSLIATGFPYSAFEKMDEFLLTLNWFIQNTRGLRRLGSAATDIAWVAAGRYDGFYEKGLNAWDVAAGIVLLREAGGQCSDFSGGDDYLFGNEIICSNGAIHDEFINVIDEIMNT